MEKILVGIEAKMTSLWPVIYALNLAKRMDVRLYILLVEDSSLGPMKQEADLEDESMLKDQIETLILKGRSEGLFIDYYKTGGSYTDALITFIQEKKISLLVVGNPFQEKQKTSHNIPDMLKEIRLRTNCRIEVVQQKLDNKERKRS